MSVTLTFLKILVCVMMVPSTITSGRGDADYAYEKVFDDLVKVNEITLDEMLKRLQKEVRDRNERKCFVEEEVDIEKMMVEYVNKSFASVSRTFLMMQDVMQDVAEHFKDTPCPREEESFENTFNTEESFENSFNTEEYFENTFITEESFENTFNAECSGYEFKCESGECIPGDLYCDGLADCLDESDEPHSCLDDPLSPTPAPCEEDQFMCRESGLCIAFWWKCDGAMDCSDGSDEEDCGQDDTLSPTPAPCEEDQFMCRESGHCIAFWWKCDGATDCSDGSDEEDCGQHLCGQEHFQCKSLETCISQDLMCDGFLDCMDGSDEHDCLVEKTMDGRSSENIEESCPFPNFPCNLTDRSLCLFFDQIIPPKVMLGYGMDNAELLQAVMDYRKNVQSTPAYTQGNFFIREDEYFLQDLDPKEVADRFDRLQDICSKMQVIYDDHSSKVGKQAEADNETRTESEYGHDFPAREFPFSDQGNLSGPFQPPLIRVNQSRNFNLFSKIYDAVGVVDDILSDIFSPNNSVSFEVKDENFNASFFTMQVTCGDGEFACIRERRCIPAEKRCDSRHDCIHGEDEYGCLKQETGRASKTRPENSCKEDEGCLESKPGFLPHIVYYKNVEGTCKEGWFFCKTYTRGMCLPVAWMCDGISDCIDWTDEAFCNETANASTFLARSARTNFTDSDRSKDLENTSGMEIVGASPPPEANATVSSKDTFSASELLDKDTESLGLHTLSPKDQENEKENYDATTTHPTTPKITRKEMQPTYSAITTESYRTEDTGEQEMPYSSGEDTMTSPIPTYLFDSLANPAAIQLAMPTEPHYPLGTSEDSPTTVSQRLTPIATSKYETTTTSEIFTTTQNDNQYYTTSEQRLTTSNSELTVTTLNHQVGNEGSKKYHSPEVTSTYDSSMHSVLTVEPYFKDDTTETKGLTSTTEAFKSTSVSERLMVTHDYKAHSPTSSPQPEASSSTTIKIVMTSPTNIHESIGTQKIKTETDSPTPPAYLLNGLILSSGLITAVKQRPEDLTLKKATSEPPKDADPEVERNDFKSASGERLSTQIYGQTSSSVTESTLPYSFTHTTGRTQTTTTVTENDVINKHLKKIIPCSEEVSFECSPSLCIDTDGVCDGNIDCPNRKDEEIWCEMVQKGFLLVSLGKRLELFSLDVRRSIRFHSERRRHIIGVAYDPVTKEVYWTTSSSYHASVYRKNIGSRKEPRLFISSSNILQGIALDWEGRNLYVAETEAGRIRVCSLKTADCASLLQTKAYPTSIQLDLRERTVYWTDTRTPSIERADMDGRNRRVLVSKDLGWPNGLAIDFDLRRIYWMDGNYDVIEYVTMDRTVRGVVTNTSSIYPYGVAVWGDNIYWTDLLRKQALQCNKWNCSDVQLFTSAAMPGRMSVYHPSLLKDVEQVSNPCASSPCSHLCLLSRTSSRGYTCACPEGTSLFRDQKTCF